MSGIRGTPGTADAAPAVPSTMTRLTPLILAVSLFVIGCGAEEPAGDGGAVLEIRFSGGCYMAGSCPQYVIYGDGRIEAGRSQSGLRFDVTSDGRMDAELVDTAVRSLVVADLDGLAERHTRGCIAPVDGIDAQLALPGVPRSLDCVDLGGIAADVPAFGELIAEAVELLGEDAESLRLSIGAD